MKTDGIPAGGIKKLVPNFYDKESYILQHKNFQLYLKPGLKLEEIVLELDKSK